MLKKVKKSLIISLTVAVAMVFSFVPVDIPDNVQTVQTVSQVEALSKIPSYSGKSSVKLHKAPSFTATQKKNKTAFEKYSRLDSLGRCGTAFANICPKIMPKGERGNISSIHPTGWRTGVGYNRCHLIGYQLAGENANERNLITGTQYFNVSGMLPYENMVADYVEETSNHVLYRVTPVFKGKELVARGVRMEAWSVEDKGDGICFDVYCFNVFKNNSPKINYLTGAVGKSKKITVGCKTKTYKANVLKTTKRFSMKIKTSGKYSCKKTAGSKRLMVSKKGVVAVKKGTKTGKYLMKVRIKNSSVTKNVIVKVTVKKTSAKSSKAATGYSGSVFWTASGGCYHSTKNCPALSRSKNVVHGSLSNAKSLGKRACKVCH